MKIVDSHPRQAAAPVVPCALQQHPGYGRALCRLGARVTVRSVWQGARRIAQSQVVSRGIGPLSLNWMARGPVWSPDALDFEKRNALKALRRDVQLRGQSLAIPDSADDTPFFAATGHRPLLTPQSVAEIDLSLDRDARLANQHGKWRNRLRHAQNAGLAVQHRPLDLNTDRPLLALEAAQSRARRYAGLPPAFTLAWAERSPSTTRLFLASHRGEPAAYLLLLLHRPAATYHAGWTGAVGRETSAHALLLWQAANWLAEQGYLRLDLGSVDTENAPGLARFKLGSGAALRPLGPTLLALPRLIRRRAAA